VNHWHWKWGWACGLGQSIWLRVALGAELGTELLGAGLGVTLGAGLGTWLGSRLRPGLGHTLKDRLGSVLTAVLEQWWVLCRGTFIVCMLPYYYTVFQLSIKL